MQSPETGPVKKEVFFWEDIPAQEFTSLVKNIRKKNKNFFRDGKKNKRRNTSKGIC
jgi:hypothetical protein